MNTALMACIDLSILVRADVILDLKILKHVHTQKELLSDDKQNSHGISHVNPKTNSRVVTPC